MIQALVQHEVKSQGFFMLSAQRGRLCQKTTPCEKVFGPTRAALFGFL